MLRNKLQMLVEKFGVTYQFIATGAGLDRTYVSKYCRGQRQIGETAERKLQNWLDSYLQEFQELMM